MGRPRKADRLTNMSDLVCDERIVHVEAVRDARAVLPSGVLLSGLADIFATLGDPTRLRIIAALASQELCVCDLAATVGTTDSAVSHQLRQLRALGLVRARRAGRRMYYSLDDAHVETLYREALNHVAHQIEGAD